MFRLVYCDDEQNTRLGAWLAERMRVASTAYWTAAIMRDDELVGGVIYHSYRPPSLEMGVFCSDPRWILSRRGIMDALAYPFLQLKCQRITATVSDKNPRLQTLLELMGFEREGTIRYGEPDGSSVGLFGLLKRDLKWASLRHAQNTSGMTLSVATH